MGEFNIDATDWILVATKGSKYAHAPNWQPWTHDMTNAACGQIRGTDPYRLTNVNAEGKPPCPRCIRILRHHLAWLTEWTDSYENLTWPDTQPVSKEGFE
jgi:hypothetical protein